MNKKISKIKISQVSQSPNWKSSNHQQIVKRKRNRQESNRLINSVKKLRFGNQFQLFILTTSLIFSFGGFGFGFILKWGDSFQFSQSSLSTSNQNVTHHLTR